MANRNKHFVRLNLAVIIGAALLVELTTGVLYYSAQRIMQSTMEKMVSQEMNAVSLTIRNQLSKVEAAIDNAAWVVTYDLSDPDKMPVATHEMVLYNPTFHGCGIAFAPDYYPEKGRFFEPYSRRTPDGIETIQLGSDGGDYTVDEYFRIPFAEGKPNWSEPYMDPDGAETVITTYGAPVMDRSGKTVGVVYADLALDWLENLIEEHSLYKDSRRFLITGSGNLIFGMQSKAFQYASEQVSEDEDKTGYITLPDDQGEKRHVFFNPIGGSTDWILVSSLGDDEVFGPLRRVRLLMLLLIGSGLILLGFIVFRISGHLEKLRQVNAEKDRISGELKVASDIQQNLLPPRQLHHQNVDICGSLVPAREVGGDLFDYYIRDGKLFFCIGDVSGKGAPSAMLMGVAHALFRAISAHEDDPARIMHAINLNACKRNRSNMFITIFMGVLDLSSGEIRYCNAGHDRPLVLGKELTPIDTKPNIPVGVFDDIQYQSRQFTLEPDSTLFLYTDGLTEAMDKSHAQFGLKRVNEALSGKSGMSPEEILNCVSEALKAFVGNAEQSDDLTLMAIRYKAETKE